MSQFDWTIEDGEPGDDGLYSEETVQRSVGFFGALAATMLFGGSYAYSRWLSDTYISDGQLTVKLIMFLVAAGITAWAYVTAQAMRAEDEDSPEYQQYLANLATWERHISTPRIPRPEPGYRTDYKGQRMSQEAYEDIAARSEKSRASSKAEDYERYEEAFEDFEED